MSITIHVCRCLTVECARPTISIPSSPLPSTLNSYMDTARRSLQGLCWSLGFASTLTGSLAVTIGSQLVGTLMLLKAQMMGQALDWTRIKATQAIQDSPSPRQSTQDSTQLPTQLRLVSVVCGFAKDNDLYPNYCRGQFGEDAWFKTSTASADTLGVADGVGGWRLYDIDPGRFSCFLMRSCERITHSVEYDATQPAQLLARAYCNLLEQKQPILGSSTACVMALHRDSHTLYAANIGDSGLLVIRDGFIVCRSMEQQHQFNTPYQLAVPPPGHALNVLTDGPECAALLQFDVECGDIVLLATDGVYDNVPDEMLLHMLSPACGIADPVKLQMYANSVALMARSLSFSPTYDSPFSQHAKRHNIDAPGGKPDDITIILASVI